MSLETETQFRDSIPDLHHNMLWLRMRCLMSLCLEWNL